MSIAPKRILVVDDEPLVCLSLKMLLGTEGHRVVTANSAEEAWAILCGGGFDLVIADYAMPRINGDQLAVRIKARWPRQPVILVTVYAEMLASTPGQAACAEAFISKPFRMDELRQAVWRVTGPAESTPACAA
jgi:CheY-like chemotaxis protein